MNKTRKTQVTLSAAKDKKSVKPASAVDSAVMTIDSAFNALSIQAGISPKADKFSLTAGAR